MRRVTVVATCALALLACSTPLLVPADGRLPEALSELTLVEGHPTISRVEFNHALHVDPAVMGDDVSCVDCHHPLKDDPQAIPRRCTDCHEFAFMLPPVDESQPHEHHGPPDL